MQVKDFQQTALNRLDLYLGKLQEANASAMAVKKLLMDNPQLDIPIPDFTELAWQKMLDAGEVGRSDAYSPRADGMGNPVPCVTLKVPTGGGKTFLAVHSAAKILDQYFANATDKVILWIVPSEAIYSQTKAKLINRDHPFRRLLDIASGGRVRILEKDTPLHKQDLAGHLTVMLLMLPSANRQDAVNKLKLFKDRGNVNGFLPPYDDIPAHTALKQQVPNLDFITQGDFEAGEATGLVRASLGNALRLIQPLVVLDEGHKAFSDLAHNTLYGFNPRFVLELSATPKDSSQRKSNWLVNISGVDLEKEDMIKMPILVTVTPDHSWKDCLRQAWQQVECLQTEANTLESNGGEYIRPILLVQVENTGDRIEGKIHSDDARAYLMGLGVPEDAIAIKTSDKDELKLLEVQNLLDRACPVRAIITKQALQEGWDCPFAYVLCSLAASRSANAMTQLIGRILRQPYVQKTSIDTLNQCYVYTYRVETAEIVQQVKKSLENEGMGDLAGRVVDTSSDTVTSLVRKRREPYRDRTYYLPQVVVYEGPGATRLLDWETDILSAIDFSSLAILPPEGGLPKGIAELLGGVVAVDFTILDGGRAKIVDGGKSAAAFDKVFAVRALQDFVPNPWTAYDLVNAYMAALLSGGWTEQELGEQQQYIVRELVKTAAQAIDVAARTVFEEGLKSGRIAFNLIAEKWWPSWQIPETSTIDIGNKSKKLRREDDTDLDKDLFPPTYQMELNGLELKVACFADRQHAISWWYRNLVRGEAYGLQGWRRNRMYPDFIIAEEANGDVERWLVIETKGDQLSGNLDSEYKKHLMQTLTKNYQEPVEAIGQLTLFENKAKYVCALVAEGEWETRMRELLN